jgi:hypothetical protein
MKNLNILILLLLLSLSASSQTYNYYYGNLHAHSDYSDGNQDKATSGLSLPWQDFNYAKNTYHFDFLGISEHNHSAVGMTKANYVNGLIQADSTTTPTFLSLYGMEWGVTTNSYDGHVLIYGINSLIGWEAGNYDVYCAKSDYPSLWSIINSYPGAFASICHPSSGQFQNLDGIAYNTAADDAIVATVVRSGAAFSTTTNYSDPLPSSSFYESYFKKMLAKGYKLGPVIDHDNHNTTFGRTAHTRTVVLATALTKADIFDAYKNMRFYASDDWNVQVSFTMNAYPMGTVTNTFGPSSINVTVTDPDAGDNVSSIQLYYGVPGSGTDATVLTSNTNSSTLNYTHTTSVGDVYYYYAKITQVDGDIIWTSPIWINRLNSALSVTGLDMNAYVLNDMAKIEWTVQSEFNVAGYEIERAYHGNDFQTIGFIPSQRGTTTLTSAYSFIDSAAMPGTQFYRIKQIDHNRQASYSRIAAVTIKDKRLQLLSLAPNPVKDFLNIRLSAAVEGAMMIKVYNTEGRLLTTQNASIVSGTNDIKLNADKLPAGIYMLVMEMNSHRILETKFMKQ